MAFLNFDRASLPPMIPGIGTQFSADAKEAMFRVLKESVPAGGKIDLFLYTRGGDTNAVWPMVSLLREFDPDFEVLVPFRCHSAGTLVALGATRITMGPISELSPIDPTTGNQFNPQDPVNLANRLAISVEDVRAYREFVASQFSRNLADSVSDSLISPFIERLTSTVHPLALGNVHRVHQQIKQLAKSLLELHPIGERDVDSIIAELTTRFYSHLHMINRNEAARILGKEHVVFAPDDLVIAMDALLGRYKTDFALYRPFILSAGLGEKHEESVRFIGAVVEARPWSYVYATRALLRQHSKLPPNVQLQIPPGQPLPLIPGLPREYNIEVTDQGWERNTTPKGVTL